MNSLQGLLFNQKLLPPKAAAVQCIAWPPISFTGSHFVKMNPNIDNRPVHQHYEWSCLFLSSDKSLIQLCFLRSFLTAPEVFKITGLTASLAVLVSCQCQMRAFLWETVKTDGSIEPLPVKRSLLKMCKPIKPLWLPRVEALKA